MTPNILNRDQVSLNNNTNPTLYDLGSNSKQMYKTMHKKSSSNIMYSFIQVAKVN